ncbi:NAD(P)/FAD-dependent oxidoreductase [Candidatus Latescibacterota bacterium]
MVVIETMPRAIGPETVREEKIQTKSSAFITAPDTGSFDVVVIGGGPAGITAGIYLMRKMINTLMITPELGGQVNWTTAVENYPGYMEISGIELAQKYKAQLEQFPLTMRLGDSVVAMEMTKKGGIVRTEGGAEYAFTSVVIASGKRSRKLGVAGEDTLYGHGVTYCATCDGPLYREEEVAVIGGGNSALSVANDLLGIGCTVHVVNIMPDFQADRILVEKAGRHGTVTFHQNHEVTEIHGTRAVEGITIRDRESGTRTRLAVTGVFIEIGLTPNSQFAENVVAMNAHHEIIVDCRCMTDMPSVYAAGDVTNVPNKQIIIAAGEGAKAALAVGDYLLKRGD